MTRGVKLITNWKLNIYIYCKMLILNKKHKDYYDGVVGSIGMDKTIVYERKLVEMNSQEMPKQFRCRRFSWDDNNPFLSVCHANIDHKKTKKYEDVRGFIIGFCGKLYLGWKFEYKVMEWDDELGLHPVTKTHFIYGYEEAKKYLKADYWRSSLGDDIRYVINYDPIDLFRELKTPIFVFDGDSRSPRKDDAFIINPILKDYEFYKVVDAFTAFTELQMFIGGVLGVGEKEMVEIEDKYKIGQHGFDNWSFRREPTKKRR